MIVMKFGGVSLESVENIKKVVQIIRYNRDKNPIIVLSAMGKTTNQIIKTISDAKKGVKNSEFLLYYKRIISELELDFSPFDELFIECSTLIGEFHNCLDSCQFKESKLLSYGEIISCRIMARLLTKTGCSAKDYTAREIGMCTNSSSINAKILEKSYENVRVTLNKLMMNSGEVPIVTGFIGQDQFGNTTTLGRGGSDLTATFIGAALEVDEIWLWKNVDGLLTADPKMIPEAGKVDFLSFEEAHKLALFNSSIIHQDAIVPAMKCNVKIRIKNFMSPDAAGTLIGNLPCCADPVTIAKNSCKSFFLVKPRNKRARNILNDIIRSFYQDFPKSLIIMEVGPLGFLIENYPGVFKQIRTLARNSAKFVFLKDISVLEVVCNSTYSSTARHVTAKVLYMNNIPCLYFSGIKDNLVRVITYDSNTNLLIKQLHHELFEKNTSPLL